MFCEYCGKEINDDAKFCPHCGNGLNISVGAQGTQSMVQSNNYGKAKSNNIGLKIAFFIMLFVSILALVVTGITLLIGNVSKPELVSIFEEEPKVDKKIYEDWGDRPFAIGEIGSEEKKIETGAEAFIGVWLITGTKINIEDETFLEIYEDESTLNYIVMDDKGYCNHMTMTPDQVVLYHEQIAYEIDGSTMIMEAPMGSPEGATVEYRIVDGQLYGLIRLEDVGISEWVVYAPIDKSIDEMLALIASIQETDHEDSDVDTADETDESQLSTVIIGAWEKDEGSSYFGLEFYIDGTFRYIEQYDNDEAYDVIMDYEIFSNNQIMLGADNDVYTITVDYDEQFGEYYLILQNGDDIIEMNQTEMLGAISGVYDGEYISGEMIEDIEGAISNTTWTATGNEYYDDRYKPWGDYDYDLEYGELVYFFENGKVTSGTHTDAYMVDPDGYYIYGFSREVEFNGEIDNLHSVFYIENDYLYETEFFGDEPISNILEFELQDN